MQRFAFRTDALERRRQAVAGRREIRRPRLPPRQHLVQGRQQLARVGPKRGQPGRELRLAAVRELLEQELGVADDVVERRAQLVPELRGRIDAHAPPARPSSASIFSTSRVKSTGLVSKSSQPAPMAFSRSPDIACAVSAITGIRCVSGAALIRRVASQPSSPGRLMSIKISAGASERAIATPCSPSTARATSY